MARFYPIYVRRSDGKLEVVSKGKRRELNQPTHHQLDQRPDRDGVSDFYREVGADEGKHVDWRRKLGGMLARELAWKDKSGQEHGYILVAFPDQYRLYEHVKKTVVDGKLEVKSKTHAAGGNDRQDAYLYGHPAGRRKRFRSPNDFFPHLLWLCTDESGDPDNCSCKICSPEDLENVLPAAKVKTDKAAKPEPDSKDALRMHAGSQMARQTSQQAARSPQVQVQRPVSAQRQLSPTPLPPQKSPDQAMDARFQMFMYRPGELAWFKRGYAWGIGVVLRRWLDTSNNTNSTFYQIQPLSYPSGNPGLHVKQGNEEMRPWLAWSVPAFTNKGLNDQQTPPRYETADWQGMASGRYGTGDLEVDGSIMAAKMVDSTYTLFGKDKVLQPEPGVQEVHYDGIFLGAEKIWVGDPVRLHIGTGTDVMVVHSIMERKRVSPVNPQQVLEQAPYFVGDVYQLATVPHQNVSIETPAAPNRNPHLPARLTEDLMDRNKCTVEVKRVASFWRLTSAQQRVDLNNVKGRWYEATLILAQLHPEVWAEQKRKGEIQEASLWMNSRGDCLNSNRSPQLPRIPRENNRRETRVAALGQAVPQNIQIVDGTDPPPSNDKMSDPIDIDPKFETAEDSGTINVSQPDGGNDGLVDDFMNLEGMDQESIPGFGQEYGSQGGGHGYF
ncbi:hypothetical protein AC579_2001 [Pseudocercospora musae]|uniref:Cryptic loci regulator 2 N-terminal domain-containing protein n=1 Tax=Pseudocercospora musae TaxID=113226 RepID=A0A139IR01_9PEZI|nr:hypothetical protein AC579_2001 [Pseudocercospora musae]